MKQSVAIIALVVLISEVRSAPQLISVKDGKLGVNFGGYHASVGLGGPSGLFASAGTPYGQAASAGLGGSAGPNGQGGGLYAGATAGNNIKAEAGLAGATIGNRAGGAGFASAQAGNRIAASGLGGTSTDQGNSGFTYSGTNILGIPTGVISESTVPKKTHTQINVDAANNVDFQLPLTNKFGSETEEKLEVKPIVAQEVESAPSNVKPDRNYYQTVGYVNSAASPSLNTRLDVESGITGTVNVGAVPVVTKDVTIEKNPSFFSDIFNIPIATLQAVSNLLGNAVGTTSVSIQKSATTSTDADKIISKHAPSSFASSSTTDTHVSVEAQPGNFFADIFSIPINTLDAVNKFLGNNVPARKRIQITHEISEGEAQPLLRFGPHARKRAAKRLIFLQENQKSATN